VAEFEQLALDYPQLGFSRLPQRRVVIRSEFPALPGPGSQELAAGRAAWRRILPQRPGGEEELVVLIHDPVAFARWHMAQIERGDALRSGAIEVQGSRTLARALPTWNRRGWAADDPRGRFEHPARPAVEPERRLSRAGPDPGKARSRSNTVQ
jgi:hypothetical protein